MAMPADGLTLRRLLPEEWEAVRAFRLGALRAAPGNFFTPHEETASRPTSHWTDMLADPDAALFGLFDSIDMVGMTGVFVDRDDPTNPTAFLGMSFIMPAYRGRGLTRTLFEARIAWARARGLRRAVVYSRASNLPSRRAIERHGFKHVGATDHVWPDGTTDPDLKYELALSDTGQASRLDTGNGAG